MLGRQAPVEFSRPLPDGERRPYGAQGVVLLDKGRVEERDHRVTDELVEGALLVEDGFGSNAEVFIQGVDEGFRRMPHAEVDEPPQIGEEAGDLLPHSPQLQLLRIVRQPLDDGGRQVALEEAETRLELALAREILHHDCHSLQWPGPLPEGRQGHTEVDELTGRK